MYTIQEIVCHEGFTHCPERSEGSSIKPVLPAPLSCSHAFKGVFWGQVWVFGHEKKFLSKSTQKDAPWPISTGKIKKKCHWLALLGLQWMAWHSLLRATAADKQRFTEDKPAGQWS